MKSLIHNRFVFALTVLSVLSVLAVATVSAQGQFAGHEEAEVQEYTANEDGVVEIEFSNDGYQFLPTRVQVPQGSTVRVTYTSDGRHDWILEGYEVGTEVLSTGESETIEFVADEAGEFEFYCSVMNHRERGMYGSFVVQ